jgi:hypothetical protein
VARREGDEVTNHAKGFAPVVKFPTGGVTLLLAGAGRSRKDVKRRLWFFNSKREHVEVLEVLPVSVVARTWPEPCREPLAYRDLYWFPDVSRHESVWGTCWDGDAEDMHRLAHGLVHLTLEAAQAHAEALLSLSK